MLKNKKNSSSKNKIILIILFIILIVVGLFTVKIIRTTPSDGSIDDSGSNINYGPPTEEEKLEANSQKERNVENQNKEKSSLSPIQDRHDISVLITDAGQYDDIIEVRSFMPDYYQDGVCVITFIKESYQVSKTTPAYRDASSTICTNPLIKRSEFATSGNWQVVVRYSSEGAEGSSEPKIVEIY